MKLKGIHLFMIFLFFLIVAPFVSPLVEGMATMRNLESLTDKKTQKMKNVKSKQKETYEGIDHVIVDKNTLNQDCPPCPPCARCPEPAFDCKKVPNYDINTPEVVDKYLPKPVLTDFSEFKN